jgi:predicted class III extradiol MEMO1 family dioxygenase
MTTPLDYDQVHSANFRPKFFWDGYTLVFVKPNHSAYTQKNSVFYRGRWHTVLDRVSFDDNGIWNVRSSYVK